MRKVVVFFVCLALASCEYVQNHHIRYTNGVVVTESRGFNGVYVEVDTTRDGVADLKAKILGYEMLYHFQKGDTVSVDICQTENFAGLIASGNKSKQDTTKVK